MQTLDLKGRWTDGRVVLGAWTALASPFAAELLAVDGVDYVCVDQQHGVVDYVDLLAMIPAIERHGKVALTRVPANDAWLIGRALDAGVSGVVVPMVETAADAARAVAACRYAPDGIRSFGPLRAALTHGTAQAAELQKALCLVMVETRRGIENLAEIVATPGLDGIYVGPGDLGLSLGYQPTLNPVDEEHVKAVEAVAAACREAGLVAGIQCSDGGAARRWMAAGFSMVTIMKDSALLQAGAKAEVLAARGADRETGPSVYT